MMNKMTKLFLALMMLTLTFGSMQNANAAGTQRVIVEEFTGTWCGWCPGGIQNVEDMVSVYGADKIIPIMVHNGDPMATAHEQKLAQFFKVGGYPNGMVNRSPINKGQSVLVAIDRGAYDEKGGDWGDIASQILKNSPAADIDVTYFVDPATNVLTATVKATILADVKSQTVFNAIIIENEVVPANSTNAWKQANYYAGRAGNESHPWYSKSSLVSMTFQEVLRDYMGGHLGEATGLPMTLKAGEVYTRSFSKALAPGVRVENIKVIGYLGNSSANYTGNAIINSNYGTKVAPTVAITGSGANIVVTPTNNNSEKSWTCKNLTNGPVDFAVSVKMSGRTPLDWKAVVDQAVVTAAGGASANCKIIVTPGATLGIGDAMVTITPTVGEPSTFKLTVISKELERVVFNYSSMSDLSPILESLDDYKGFTTLTTEETAASLSTLTSLKIAVANTGSDMSLDQSTANSLAALFTNKRVKLFLHGSNLVSNMMLSQTPIANNITNIFGFTSTAANIIKVNTYNVSGVSGDPIGNGFKASNVPQKGNFYPLTMSQGNGSKAVKFLNIDGQTEGGIGFRMEGTDLTRVVFLNQDLFSYADETQRAILTKKIMDWLTGTVTETPVPIVTTSGTKLDFGVEKEVNIDHNLVLTISNTGTADLQIQKPEFAFGDAGFTFSDGNTYPIILKKSASTTMRVTWAPKVANKSYIESFTFATNDKVTPEVTINLTGKTAPVNSVEDGTFGVFTAKLSNNPVVDNSTVNFVVGGSNEQNVNIKLIDASGAIVGTLANANYMPGTYNVNLSTSNLASGTYFILANAAGVQAKLTAVVVK